MSEIIETLYEMEGVSKVRKNNNNQRSKQDLRTETDKKLPDQCSAMLNFNYTMLVLHEMKYSHSVDFHKSL